MERFKTTLLAVAALGSSAATSHAAVMDFTGLVDYNDFSQNGLSMTSSFVRNFPGTNEAHMDNGFAIFRLSTLGFFSLNSVYINDSGGIGPANFTAYSAGSNLGSVDIFSGGTHHFGSLFSNIDEFRVLVTGDPFTFDDINFTPIVAAPPPTPTSNVPDGGSTVALLGLAMTAAAGLRRKFAP